MKNTTDKRILLWCEEVINNIRATKNSIRRNRIKWKNKENQTEESSQKSRNIERRWTHEQCKYVKYIYKNCLFLQKILHYKVHSTRFKKIKFFPQKPSEHFINGNIYVNANVREDIHLVDTEYAPDNATVKILHRKKDIKWGKSDIHGFKQRKIPHNLVECVQNGAYKDKVDLIVIQTIILTLFEPALLKISLKHFNFLTASIVNHIFEEVLLLARYNYGEVANVKEELSNISVREANLISSMGEETVIERELLGKDDISRMKKRKKKIDKSCLKEDKNPLPALHIYNYIKKYNIDIEIYFCMICMNSILFSKELFFKNAIDYFFKEVFPKSEHCYNYLNTIVMKYVKEQDASRGKGKNISFMVNEVTSRTIPPFPYCIESSNVCYSSASIYRIYCGKILLIFYYLNVEKALHKTYLNLLPEILKCKKRNPFFEDLIYLIYLHYHEIGSFRCEERIFINQLIREGRLPINCKSVSLIDKKKCIPPDFSIFSRNNHDLVNYVSRDITHKVSLEGKKDETLDIHHILLKHKQNMKDLKNLYIEKFRLNIAEIGFFKFFVNIESVLYPSFCLKDKQIEKESKVESNFVVTKRLIRIIEMLATNIYNNKPTIIIGNQGSGKTSLIKYIYKKIFENEKEKNENIISLYLDDVTDSKSILGIWESNEKCFEFKYGILAKAMKCGNWIIFENVNNISNSVVEKLYELTSKGYIYLSEKGENIYPHKNFRLFATITMDKTNTRMDDLCNSSEGHKNYEQKCDPISGGNDKRDYFKKRENKLQAKRPRERTDNNKELNELILLNHRPNNLSDMFNKWHSVHVGNYSESEIKEIAFKRLKNGMNENYINILLKCYSCIKSFLENYHILRNINMHDLVKIIKRVKKKWIFMHENEKTKVILFQTCKSIFISHIPNANLRLYFLKILIKIFGLDEKSVIKWLKSYTVTDYINQFNETLKKKNQKISLNFHKIDNYSFFLTSVHKSILYEIIEGVYNKESILLIGDTGVGKTALIDYISKIFEKKLHVFVFSEQSEASDLIGNYYPFNISVKTNELFEELKCLNSKISDYLCPKELHIFYLKLRIILSEKKFITFLNTCHNFAKCLIDNFENDTTIFDMHIVKKYRIFQHDCKGVVDFWNSSITTGDRSGKDKAVNAARGSIEFPALKYNFEKFFKKGNQRHNKDLVQNGYLNRNKQNEGKTFHGNGIVKKKQNEQWEGEQEEEKWNPTMNELIFRFHDGILIDCIKNGYWLLLDEINLAQTEILQRLQGILDLSNKYFDVVEKGNEKIKIHPNFRLFACMNPPIIPNLKKSQNSSSGKRSNNGNSNNGNSSNGNSNNGNSNNGNNNITKKSATVGGSTPGDDSSQASGRKDTHQADTVNNISKGATEEESNLKGETDHHIDLYNSSISSGKKELPPIIRNKFTEIFLDEILEYDDVEMIVKNLLKGITCDNSLLKNITNCYLEIKKESLKNMNNSENKPIFFSTRNLVRAIHFAVSVHKRKFKPLPLQSAIRNGFVCNFLSCANVDNQKIIEHIFNKYFKCAHEKSTQQCNGVLKDDRSMQIEKTGMINYSMLENYYQYTYFDKKNGVKGEKNLHSLFIKNKNDINNGGEAEKNHLEGKRGRNKDQMEKYICVENNWILCGKEEINILNILSNFIITKNVKENIKKLALCLSGTKTPILLEGNTSVGKTSLVKFFADITGHKFVRINNHMNTDINEYYGQFVNDKNSGNLIFEEGVFVKAVRYGYWVVLDELNLAPSEVLESLNRILDDNKELYIPELKRYVKAHKDFMLFATQNPANNNNYLGRKELSKAFRSRFIEFHINDFEDNELEIILHRRCAISPSVSKKMIQVYTELRSVKSNYNCFNDNLMTLRDLIKWGNRHPSNNSDACLHGYYIIAEKLRNEKDKKRVKDILSKIFLCKGEELSVQYEDDHDLHTFKDAFLKKISCLSNLSHKSRGLNTCDNVNVKMKKRINCDDVKRLQYLKKMHLGNNTSRILCLLLKCFKYKESVLLIGETGCGKTTCCELVSFVKNLKLNILNCNESTDVYDIIGSLKLVKNKKENYEKLKKNCIELYNEISQNYADAFAANFLSGIIHDQIGEVKKEDFLIFCLYLQKKYNLNENIKNKLIKMEKSINNLKSVFTWFDGILVASLKRGDIFLMDEISLVESAVIERLNSVLEYERTLLLTEKGGKNIKNLKAHEQFSFIGTMNPSGDFGKKEISQTLKNRFTEIFVPTFSYESDDFYFLIMKQMKFTKMKKLKHATANCLCKLFHQISQNKAFSNYFTLSIRDAIKWISFMNIYITGRKEICVNKGRELFIEKDKISKSTKLPKRRLKRYISISFYHSGCLILIDGNEDMKTKQILKQIMMKTLEELCFSINYQLTNEKREKNGKEILEKYFDKTCNFKFKKKYLQVNDLRIKFRRKLSAHINKFAKNSNFVFDTPNIKKNLFKIVRAMQLDNSILLEGSPGVGKTCIINILAKLTNNKLIRINLSECTDIYDFIGSYFPVKDEKKAPKNGNCVKETNIKPRLGGETNGKKVEQRKEPYIATDIEDKKGPKKDALSFQYFWKDGKLIECMKKGYWILIDEINLANQQTLEGLNSILDHRKEIFIPETNETVKSHKNFRLFCCQNPYSEGGGRKGLPKSFLNRFSKIYFDELKEEDYISIVEKLYGTYISEENIKKIISITFLIKKINHLLKESDCWVWNLRDILRICKFIKYSRTSEANFLAICDMLICSRLTCSQDREIVRCVILNAYNASSYSRNGEQEFLKSISKVTTREGLLSLVRNSELKMWSAFFTSLYYNEINFFFPNRKGKKNSISDKWGQIQRHMTRSTLILSKDEKTFYACEAGIRLNIPILLNGKNNAGKSSFVHNLAYIFQKKIFEFSLTNDMDTFDLFGSYEQNSRDNVIKKMERKIFRLNKLILKHIFKKRNFKKFYCSYFKKRESQNKTKQMKIRIMERISYLSEIFINSLKENTPSNEEDATNADTASVEQPYLHFIHISMMTMRRSRRRNRINETLLNVTHLFKMIRDNHINENVYVYNEGNFIKAIKNGHWVLIKHLHLSTPSLLDRLNSLFEENGYILLHEFGKKKKIKPHKNFQIFLTLNSEEHYKISRALRNRCFEIHFGDYSCEYVGNSINLYDRSGASVFSQLDHSPLLHSNKKSEQLKVTKHDEMMLSLDGEILHEEESKGYSAKGYSAKEEYHYTHIATNGCQTKLNNSNDEYTRNSFLLHLMNLCFNENNDFTNDEEKMDNWNSRNNSYVVKKVGEDDEYVNIIKNGNVFYHIMKVFLKKIQKEGRNVSIKVLTDFNVEDGSKLSEDLKTELITLFFNKEEIKINCTKILDYVNYCCNCFVSMYGVRLTANIICFCIIISLTTYIIEYMLQEEVVMEIRQMLRKEEKKERKANCPQNFKNNINALFNHKFENNFYYIDKYIMHICSNFLLARQSSKRGGSNIGGVFLSSNQYQSIFSNTFVIFYCQIFSKLNAKAQLFFYPLFECLNNCVIKTVLNLKMGIRNFVKDKNRILDAFILRTNNSSKFVHRIKSKYFIYFYFLTFINYVNNYYNSYSKEQKKCTFVDEESVYPSVHISKEIALINSLSQLKLNKFFCHSVYCFLQNFSFKDIFYRYEHLLNLKNRIIIRRRSNTRVGNYDTEIVRYLEFVTNKVISKNMAYFGIMRDCIYNAIYGKIWCDTKKQKQGNEKIEKCVAMSDRFIHNDDDDEKKYMRDSLRPLCAGRKYLLMHEDTKVEKMMQLFETFLKYNLSYEYFAKCDPIEKGKKKHAPSVLLMNKFLMQVEKLIFQIIKNRRNCYDEDDQNDGKEDVFNYYLFIYLFTFHEFFNFKDDNIYVKIIFLVDVLKYTFKWDKYNKKNCRLMKFLQKAKTAVAQRNLWNSPVDGNNKTLDYFDEIDNSSLNDVNMIKNRMVRWKKNKNEELMITFTNMYFYNKWVRNIFEVVNNIYISHFVHTLNISSYYCEMLNHSISSVKKEKKANMIYNFIMNKRERKSFKDNMENLLIQTKSFSHALKVLHNDYLKIANIEKLIMKNLANKNEILNMNMFSHIKESDPAKCYQNVSAWKISLERIRNDNKLDGKGNQLLFYYQFILFNIHLKYLHNAFVYLLNMYMCLKRKQFGGCEQKGLNFENSQNCDFYTCKESPDAREPKCSVEIVKEAIKQMYDYLNSMENTIFIHEEKIEILSLLKEKYGILEYSQKKQAMNKCKTNFDFDVAFVIIEELLNLLFCFLLNVYMVKDKNYQYVKEDMNKLDRTKTRGICFKFNNCKDEAMNYGYTSPRGDCEAYQKETFSSDTNFLPRLSKRCSSNSANDGNNDELDLYKKRVKQMDNEREKGLRIHRLRMHDHSIDDEVTGNNITYEAYTVFKDIYINKCFNETRTLNIYSYVCTSIFNKTVIFDSVVNIYQELKRKKITLYYLHMSKCIFESLKNSYYEYITKMTFDTVTGPSQVLQKEEMHSVNKESLNSRGKNTMRYYFSFHTFIIFFNIINRDSLKKNIEEKNNKLLMRTFEIFHFINDKRGNVSLEMLLHLLDLHKLMCNSLSDEIRDVKKIQRYAFVLLFILFKVIIKSWKEQNKRDKQKLAVRSDSNFIYASDDNPLQGTTLHQIYSTTHGSFFRKGSICHMNKWKSSEEGTFTTFNTVEETKKESNETPEHVHCYIYDYVSKQISMRNMEELEKALDFLFSENKVVTDLTKKYQEEDFLFTLGCFYISHYFLNVICSKIRKEVKDIFKQMEGKNYLKKLAASLREEVYMSSQHNMYIEKVNIFEKIPHGDFFRIKKKKQLNKHISSIKRNLPLLPKVLKNMNKKKRKKLETFVSKCSKSNSSCAYFITEYINKNILENVQTLYIKLKNDYKQFLKNILSLHNIENNVLYSLTNSINFINFSLVNTCLNFIHHLKENYSLISKFTEAATHGLCVFIHSVHSINFCLLKWRENNKTEEVEELDEEEKIKGKKKSTFSMLRLEGPKKKTNDLYKCIKFPINFNNILNLKKTSYENKLNDLEYLHFVSKLLKKPKNIFTQFDMASLLKMLKRLCRNVVFFNERDENSNMNEFFKIEQFKMKTLKEKHEYMLHKDSIEKYIEKELDDVFYSYTLFSNQMSDQVGHVFTQVDDTWNEWNNSTHNQNEQHAIDVDVEEGVEEDEYHIRYCDTKKDSSLQDANYVEKGRSNKIATDKMEKSKNVLDGVEEGERVNEVLFNKIVYKMSKLFKDGNIFDCKRKKDHNEIERTKEIIRHTLDMLIRLNGESKWNKNCDNCGSVNNVVPSIGTREEEKDCTFLLEKKSEEKRLLIFTVNMINQFNDMTKCNDEKFSNFKMKISEILEKNKQRNHAYINKYMSLLDYNFMEYIFGALNDLCFYLIHLKNEFGIIYNESNNINIWNILNAINNVLDFPINNIQNEIEKIIQKLEHLVSLINTLKNDNYINFDDASMSRVKNLMKNNILEQLLIYTVYFRLYKLKEIKNIRKNLSRKIVKNRTLNLFSYLFYLCYDDSEQDEELQDVSIKKDKKRNMTQRFNSLRNYNNNTSDCDIRTKIKIVKTFESLVIFLRDSMISEFPVRLRLTYFISHLFKNSEKESEKMMSNVFSNVYNYMLIYLPLIKKKIQNSKNYFDIQLKKALEKINFDLVDVEAYKLSIIKLKKKIAYFTKLYFQQISVTVDKFILENDFSFSLEMKKVEGSRNNKNRNSELDDTNQLTEEMSSNKVHSDLENSSETSSSCEGEEQNNAEIDSAEEEKQKQKDAHTGDDADERTRLDDMNSSVVVNDKKEGSEENSDAGEKQNCIYNQLNELRESLTKLRKKIKNKKSMDYFLIKIEFFNSFEDVSNSYVNEIKHILNVQCSNANINQKKRWIYILKHFLSKKLNISPLNDLNNFNFFANLFQNDIQFCDNIGCNFFTLEYNSPTEILTHLRNCLAYMIEQDNSLIDDKVRTNEINKLNEDMLHIEDVLQKEMKRNKIYTLEFLDKMNDILNHNEKKSAKVLYLTIYIKSLNVHEDMRNDQVLYYLFNAINYEYFNLRNEIYIFYHHFVFYYLLVISFLCEKKYELDFVQVNFEKFECFLENCNLIKSALLQMLSSDTSMLCKSYTHNISSSSFFKKLLQCIYKIAYIIHFSNEFRIFTYFKKFNMKRSNVMEELDINPSHMKLKMNVNFLKCIERCVEFLEKNLIEIYSLNIAPYFKYKIYVLIEKFVKLFYEMKDGLESTTAEGDGYSISRSCTTYDEVEKLNDQIWNFIRNIVYKKSIIYKKEYPNFQDLKNVNEIYCMKNIIKLYLLADNKYAWLKGKQKSNKPIQIFHYLSKNLFYFIKCIFLYSLDIFLGFSNISLYFLKVLKILYSKGLCRQVASGDTNGDKNGVTDEDEQKTGKEMDNEIFHKTDFLKGIGLGEGKGIKNISNQVDNEDLDNMFNEDENNFSQDENDFNEEAIEATYNFQKFCEKELNSLEQQLADGSNTCKLENEIDNLNMEKKQNKSEEKNPNDINKHRSDENDGTCPQEGEKNNDIGKEDEEHDRSNLDENHIDDIFEKHNSNNQCDLSENRDDLKDVLNGDNQEEKEVDEQKGKKPHNQEEKGVDEQTGKELHNQEEKEVGGDSTNNAPMNQQDVNTNEADQMNTDEFAQGEKSNNSDFTNLQQDYNWKENHMNDPMGKEQENLNEGNPERGNGSDFNLDSDFEIESNDFSKSCSERSIASREDNFEDHSDEEMEYKNHTNDAKMEEGKNMNRRNEQDFVEQDHEVDTHHELDEFNKLPSLDEEEGQQQQQLEEEEAMADSDDMYDGDQLEQDHFDMDKKKNDRKGQGFKTGQVEPKDDDTDVLNREPNVAEAGKGDDQGSRDIDDDADAADDSDGVDAADDADGVDAADDSDGVDAADDAYAANDADDAYAANDADDSDEETTKENSKEISDALFPPRDPSSNPTDDPAEAQKRNTSDEKRGVEGKEDRNNCEVQIERKDNNCVENESKRYNKGKEITENNLEGREDALDESYDEGKREIQPNTPQVHSKDLEMKNYEMQKAMNDFDDRGENNQNVFPKSESGKTDVKSMHREMDKNNDKRGEDVTDDDMVNSNDFSFSVDKCNIYTENFVDITNFIDKINEKLLKMNENDTHLECEKLNENLENIKENYNITKEDDKRLSKDEKTNCTDMNIDFASSGERYPIEKMRENDFDHTEKESMEGKSNVKEEIEYVQEDKKGNKNSNEMNTKTDMRLGKSAIDMINVQSVNNVQGDAEEEGEKIDQFEDHMSDTASKESATINKIQTDAEILYGTDGEEKYNKDTERGKKGSSDSETDSYYHFQNYEEEGSVRKDECYHKVHENEKVLEMKYIAEDNPENTHSSREMKMVVPQHSELHSEGHNEAYEEIYDQINNETEIMSSHLCEQLKIILEPTVRNKYEGDYKSGKKLNIKKLVNYFASDFRNNKIWKRRTKLNKRDYNIVIAIDNTKSMKINNLQKMTLNAIFLVAKAFEKLQVGRIGICSFGENEEGINSNNIVCSMTNSLNKQDFLKILNHFQFNHDTQNSFDNAMLNALKICSYILKDAHNNSTAQKSALKNSINHLMLIISDGRFNKSTVKAEIYKCIRNNFIPVLMIIDTQLSNNKAQSIFNLKQTYYKNNKLHIVPYLHDFPIPYYVVVSDINDIPTLICDVIRQWFQTLNNR
ncbi:dynein-related AAA-type ATPase [Plasmodium gonderi]|uniref:Midasin n=1 Tax=Plasmodium gonderi TaxID=77519 RepID=A0A1Y1JKD3_PLAGO|nr:dynein-related AAA-type ATPase [Plasmodium gonderi]GAW82891.1 dynein-related AAA-type ATPase [Plasmodium gonderi]